MGSIAQPWLFNKFIDPLFAVCIGVTAAALRIQREQRESYPEQDSSYVALWQKAQVMRRNYFGTETKG